ncbi:GntR family transcriptional regulator [Rhodobium gokarnense]|uniref:GntR family histidine utilization transcriptional repressor n=1 Tax=Rhodobium gokarnense TaxID=364296 RepID=A0ABT3HBD8_9HYPH|nr:GntR family transcriptional regulator [Rhodobium gokarnense]MCW2307701.1 GntR family histidine utilization transcriptional repressor [Rhodobium gokarnense]
MTDTDTNSWRGVQSELLRRINEKEWPAGSLVPNEVDLAEEFGCARTTVNRAMRELADAGLLVRRRKAGTRVATHPASRVVLDIPIIRLEVEQRNAEWRQSLIEKTACVPPVRITSRLGLDPDAQMLHVRSLHFADNHPFLHEDRWMNIAALPGVERVDFSAVSSNEWLIENAPYTTGDIAFSAMNADAALADLLEAPLGAAIFVVDRITWDKDIPITSVRLSYAPGYRMNTKI